MSQLVYAYIAKPSLKQVSNFFLEIQGLGISITHLGKSDPPRKFRGGLEEAVSMVFEGTDLTNYTFVRDSAIKLDFDFQIRNDPRWSHSTLSASCSDNVVIKNISDSVAKSFDLFATIRGLSGGGKQQNWEVIYIAENCPSELRSKYIST
jgi:hypothetical protein